MWNKLKHNEKIISGIELNLVWLPVLLVNFVNQWQYLDKNWFLPIARKVGYASSESFSYGDMAMFFQTSTIEFFIIIPIIMILGSVFINQLIFKLIILFTALSLLFLNAFNLSNMANVGTFVSTHTLIAAYDWLVENPEMLLEYFTPAHLSILFILNIAIIFPLFFSMLKRGFVKRLCRFGAITSFAITIFAGLGILLFSLSSNVSELVPRNSFMTVQFKSLWEIDDLVANVGELPQDGQSLIADFREKTNSPPLDNQSIYLGKEANKNVIFFIFETGPLSVFTSATNAASFKNLSQLKSRSFYSENHYSTYPYTSDALFSVFSSLYPDNIRRKFANGEVIAEGIGLFSILQNQGYDTNVYSIDSFEAENDFELFKNLGVNYQYFARADEKAISIIKNNENNIFSTAPEFSNLDQYNRKKITERFLFDSLALTKMLDDIEVAHKENKKFASVFLPQIGHAPWYDLSDVGGVIEDGILQFSAQDVWIGRVIDKLKELKIFDDTIIVITSDHGLRTRVEYDKFVSSRLNKISFNVPLLIYAPNTLEQQYSLPFVTSHIDIMPTVLTLMGFTADNRYMLGTPVWQEKIAERTTYFNGRWYFGNSGYSANNNFVSYNYISQTFYSGSSLDFSLDSMVMGDTESMQYTIANQQALQIKLLEVFDNIQN